MRWPVSGISYTELIFRSSNFQVVKIADGLMISYELKNCVCLELQACS